MKRPLDLLVMLAVILLSGCAHGNFANNSSSKHTTSRMGSNLVESCNQNNARACLELSWVRSIHQGDEQGNSAKSLAQKACTLGSSAACDFAERLNKAQEKSFEDDSSHCLSKESVSRVLENTEQRARSCFDEAMRWETMCADQSMNIRFIIAPEGQVLFSEVSSKQRRKPLMNQCLLRWLAKQNFETTCTADLPSEITYQLEFVCG
jgi:hypothetical protein